MKFKVVPVKCYKCMKTIEAIKVNADAKLNVIWDICSDCKKR